MKVSDAMTAEVQLCTPDDTLKDAAQAMAALGVGLLPVTDNERLVGMISDRDIAIRGIGMGRGPEARVGDVMTAEVRYCYDDQNLDEVSAIMGDIHVACRCSTVTSVSSGSLRWATSRSRKPVTAPARH